MKDLRITTGVAAALLAGACGHSQDQDNGWTADRDTAVCVDQQGKRVPDDKCPRQQQGQQVAQNQGTSHLGTNAFLWYYLGRSSAVPYYGESVRGGGYAPSRGHSYFRAPASTGVSRSAAISRGGFGSSARGGGGS